MTDFLSVINTQGQMLSQFALKLLESKSNALRITECKQSYFFAIFTKLFIWGQKKIDSSIFNNCLCNVDKKS